MDWAHHQSQFRFDIRAEHAEYERLFKLASVLQNRMVRRSRTDRTKRPAMSEWEKVYQAAARERRILHQARVLAWGEEKKYYYAHKKS